MREIDRLWIKESTQWIKEKQNDLKENNILIDNAKKMMLVANAKIKALLKQNELTKKMMFVQQKEIDKVKSRK